MASVNREEEFQIDFQTGHFADFEQSKMFRHFADIS